MPAKILPAPIRGMNFFDPLAAMPQDTSPWLLNVHCNSRNISVRPGVNLIEKLASVTNVLATAKIWNQTWGNEDLFAYCDTGVATQRIVRRRSTSGNGTVFTSGATASTQAMGFNFGNKIAFLNDNPAPNAAPYYDGAGVWAAWTLTYGGSNVGSGPFAWYRGRLYIKSYGGLTQTGIIYGDVGQVQGAVLNSVFNVEEIFESGSITAWIGTFSVSDGSSNTSYIAFGNYSGEVLVYSGDSPESDNWSLVTRLNIGYPVGFNANPVVQYENDCIVMTRAGAVSLRRLFTAGNDIKAQRASYISLGISDYWIKLTAGLAFNPALYGWNSPSGVYSKTDRRLYFLFSAALGANLIGGDTDKATILVYNVDTEAWSVWQVPKIAGEDAGNLIIRNDILHYTTNNYILGIDLTADGGGFDYDPNTETETDFDWAIWGAPTSFGDTVVTKKLQMYQPILRNPITDSFYGEAKLKATVDMGRKESGSVDPDYTTEWSKLTYSVGVEGTFFQYKLEGNTRIGVLDQACGQIEFYSMNAIYDTGGVT